MTCTVVGTTTVSYDRTVSGEVRSNVEAETALSDSDPACNDSVYQAGIIVSFFRKEDTDFPSGFAVADAEGGRVHVVATGKFVAVKVRALHEISFVCIQVSPAICDFRFNSSPK